MPEDVIFISTEQSLEGYKLTELELVLETSLTFIEIPNRGRLVVIEGVAYRVLENYWDITNQLYVVTIKELDRPGVLASLLTFVEAETGLPGPP